MKILYIGNKLANKGRTPTTVDTLGKQLGEIADVISVSDKMNPILRLLDMCYSVFKFRKSDYVIIDTYSSSAFNFAIAVGFICRILKLKYIPIIHGGNLPYRLDNSPCLSRKFFRGAYKIVSPSGYLKYEFEKRGYGNIFIVPNNIHLSDYRFKVRENFAPKILWVRAFSKTYNCEMAVDVLRLLLEKYPNAELCMVGPDKDGSMKSVIALADKYGIGTRLKITGVLSKADWQALSNDYDVFISTTNFDNTPVSIIEAMALGLPVVSTDVGGMRFLINNGVDGYLCEKGDAISMVNMIKHILSSPADTVRVCQNARKKAEIYDWQSVRKQWQDILK